MKKFTLLLSITVLALISRHQITFAQAQRLVLVEEFTQASCGPCGQENPAFNSLIENNPDKIRSLKYQVSWPGYDPMYNQNPGQVDSRVSYYGVSYVPWPWLDGSDLVSPPNLTQSVINSEYAVPSPFTLTLSHTLSPNYDSIYVTLEITAVGSVSGTINARIAVVEKEIDFATAPGSNGETVFENVMKRMLPSTGGTVLPSTINVGYTNTITEKWKLANIYDLSELAVVAWIQNDVGKEIYQAAYSEPLPINDEANITYVNAQANIACAGAISPKVTMKNLGSSTITSATISSQVGSGTISNHSWSGSLNPGSLATNIQLEPTAAPAGINTLHVWVSSVNGSLFNSSGMVGPTWPSIICFDPPAGQPIVADFTSSTFPPAGWLINNPEGITWFRSAATGADQQQPYGSAEMFLYVTPAGDIDELYAQNFDFSGPQAYSYLEFDYAKAKRTGKNDVLKVMASSNCGSSWTTLFNDNDNGTLSTATSTGTWKPTSASQWKKVVIDMNQFIGQSDVLVKFQTVSGNGNNLYIDNVNIHYGWPIGIAELPASSIMLYPNPANEEAIVHVNEIISPKTKLEVVNVLGEVVYSMPAESNSDLTINTSQFETGMYIYRLNDNGKILALDKFNVSH